MEHYTNSCDGCGATTPSPFFADDGFSFDLSGGYGQFTDYTEEDEQRLMLCHDCVLRMIALFPAMGKKLGKGCHPCMEDVPCCAFAWTQDEEGTPLVASDDVKSWVSLYI